MATLDRYTETLPSGLIDDNEEHLLIDPLRDWHAYSYVPNNCNWLDCRGKTNWITPLGPLGAAAYNGSNMPAHVYCLFASRRNDISAKSLSCPMVCVLYVTCDRCPGVCIDWLNALLIRLDWPLQTTHLDLTILPFPSHLFPPHFLPVFSLSPSSSTLSWIRWPLLLCPFWFVLPSCTSTVPTLRCLMCLNNPGSPMHICHVPNVFSWMNDELDVTVWHQLLLTRILEGWQRSYQPLGARTALALTLQVSELH